MYERKYKVINAKDAVGITEGKTYYSFREPRQNWICLYNNFGREVWYQGWRVVE